MRAFTLVGCAVALTACSDGTSPNTESRIGVGFQLARSTSPAAMDAARWGSPDGRVVVGAAPVATSTDAGLMITRDDDVIVLMRAQLVVRDVRLRTAVASCQDDDDSGSATVVTTVDVANTSVGVAASVAADGDRRGDDDDDDDCPMVRVGPFLVDMPVTGADGGRVSVPVPEGTYTSVRLRLHRVTGNNPIDAAFQQTNPDFRNISVRLEGTYNDAPFIFVGDVNASIDVPLQAPVVIGEGGDDVTVLIDPSLWFVRPAGGLYSPALANTPGFVRAAVQFNIRSAFRAFRDHDRNGRRD